MEENKEKNENQETEENQVVEEIEKPQEEKEPIETKTSKEETNQENQKSRKERIVNFFKKHYKKVLSGFMALVILALACVFIFHGCMAPKVENIYDRMVYLLESSQEVNALIYGCGLPVWEDDSEYVEFMNVYHGFEYTAQHYERVMPNAKYSSVQQMKEAIEKVYSRAYLNEVLYPAVFDGFAVSDNNGGSVIAVARYYEEEGYLWQTKDFRVKPQTEKRIYDYTTMKVRSLGKKDRCIVTMDSWFENTPEQVEKVEILIALQDGQWYLDNYVF
jgi:hypothetical protein